MATREQRTNGHIYLVVKHHSICEESKEPRDNFEAVEVNNPKTKQTITKYIDKWPGITGYVQDIEVYDTGDKYDTRFQGFKLNIDDEVILDLPQKTAAYDAFCKAAENIDFTDEVTLAAYHNRAKDRTGFSIKQNGQPVEWKYTKDNMGDCPLWEKDDDGEWNSSKQRAFLKKQIQEVVIPAVAQARAERTGEDLAPDTVNDADELAVAEAPKAEAAGATTKGKKVSDDEIPF